MQNLKSGDERVKPSEPEGFWLNGDTAFSHPQVTPNSIGDASPHDASPSVTAKLNLYDDR